MNTSHKEIFDKENEIDQDSVKVLGVRWSPETDEFQFDGTEVSEDIVVTKRVVLSVLARTFDPLGFIAPVIMSGKILFQQLWKLGIEWDEEIPQELQWEFKDLIKDIDILKSWQIARKYSFSRWSEIEQAIELHVFADASELAYGAVVYLVIADESGQKSSKGLSTLNSLFAQITMGKFYL